MASQGKCQGSCHQAAEDTSALGNGKEQQGPGTQESPVSKARGSSEGQEETRVEPRLPWFSPGATRAPSPVLHRDRPSSPPLLETDVFKDNRFDRAPAPVQQLIGERKGGKKQKKQTKP